MRKADVTGANGWQGWRVSLPETLSRPDQAATIGSWLLECPGAHAFWSRWGVSMIHLRDIPGVKPAYIRVPGATHELMAFALNPEAKNDPDDIDTWRLLTPADLEHQLVLPCDADAIEVLDLYVRRAMEGDVSPDSDFRQFWHKTLDATAQHYKEGKHGAS